MFANDCKIIQAHRLCVFVVDNYHSIIFKEARRYMAEILPIRRKTLYNQSINI